MPFKVIPVVKELGRTRMEANVSVRSLFGAKLFALNTQVCRVPSHRRPHAMLTFHICNLRHWSPRGLCLHVTGRSVLPALYLKLASNPGALVG